MAEALHTAIATKSDVKSRRLINIAWLFSAIIVFALALTYYGIGILSAARAYVGGEGLWSKAQKDMVYALARYARYQQAGDYHTFLASSKVSLGDRQARLELEKPDPDLALARAGFLQGRNHPDDIEGMISLFRNFRRVPDIDKAVGIWSRADAQIDQLLALGEKIDAAVKAGRTDESVMVPHLRELFDINQRLMPLEDAFSYTLGEAARKTQLALLIALFACVSLLLVAAVLISRRLVRQNGDMENALRQGERQLRELLQVAPMPITIVRLSDQAVLFANELAYKQFKATPETLVAAKARDFYVSIDDRDKLIAHLKAQRFVNDWEVRMRDTQGAPFWISVSSKCIMYYGQECLLSALNNIELRKRNQQELQHRAFHDELTGLPNRAMFMGTLGDTFEHKQSVGGQFSLMFLDVDRFKQINDDLGHDAGDKLLQEVARRLLACVGPADTVARLGGDEFVILVPGHADGALLEAMLGKVMAAIRKPVCFGEHAISVTASIGISCYPQDGGDLMLIMKNADLAMYRAKELGRDNFSWFEPGQFDAGHDNPQAKVRTRHRA
jgi:diguanylate cyclase (GGDEF)-like protein